MKFETVTTRDLDKIRNLQPEDWSDIVPDFEFYINSPFCNPIKTEIDGTIAGVGASILFRNTSWIAHIIVDSGYRNRGIGFQIVEELLTQLRRRPIDTCSLISTRLGQPVYIKAGFRIVSEYAFFKREKPWKEQPVSENVIPFAEKYRPAILSMDQKISGEDREELLTDFLVNSKIFIDNSELAGYYLPDLKNGPIVAETEEAGLELMKLKYSSIDTAVLPSDNRVGVEFLKRTGFVELNKQGTRMVFGKEISWEPRKIYSRIGGNVG